jgi:hypothetical protein
VIVATGRTLTKALIRFEVVCCTDIGRQQPANQRQAYPLQINKSTVLQINTNNQCCAGSGENLQSL